MDLNSLYWCDNKKCEKNVHKGGWCQGRKFENGFKSKKLLKFHKKYE